MLMPLPPFLLYISLGCSVIKLRKGEGADGICFCGKEYGSTFHHFFSLDVGDPFSTVLHNWFLKFFPMVMELQTFLIELLISFFLFIYL